jgi:hypothetical protein
MDGSLTAHISARWVIAVRIETCFWERGGKIEHAIFPHASKAINPTPIPD